MIDLRKYEPEVGVHPDFTFVSKTDAKDDLSSWDFCMSSSPAIVRSREYFIEKDGAFCSHFIKAHVPNLFETFNTIAWQSAEAKDILGGSRFPTADTADVVKVYEMFKAGHLPAKKGDWRIQKERAKVRKQHTYK